MSESSVPASPPALSKGQWRQVWWLTFGAVALFGGVRWLPTGTNLTHGDFRLAGNNVLEFCDPAAPQFLPVTTVRSPVKLAVSPMAVTSGQTVDLTFTLTTSTGKTISPVDLLVAHTRKLHLMVVDPTMQDYQHIHPEAKAEPGEWQVSFRPRLTGTYRVFADFTPAATARGLYASVDLAVSAGPPAAAPSSHRPSMLDEFIFALDVEGGVVRARDPANLTLSIRHRDDDRIELGEVMGALAHLVAFDENRSGFAHLHPRASNIDDPRDADRPDLHFQVTIPEAGRYVIWAQLALNGRESLVPFWIEVIP